MKNTLLILILVLCGCSSPKDDNYLGLVEKLPVGEYVIYNWGSRHMVRCIRPDGKYYMLNDHHFRANGIAGYDAHQYQDKTRIKIK